MPEYRVLRGTYRREDGTRAEPGDTFEVSEDTYARLNDECYERVDESDPTDTHETEPAQTDAQTDSVATDEPTDTDEPSEPVEDESESVSSVSPESVIPYEDYRLLSKMAALYEGDDIHGAMSGDEICEGFEGMDGEHVADLLSEAEAELGGDV
jgi:hypothetical protein